MSEYFKLKIKRVIRETAETISVTFDIPPELTELFKYKSGQFLTIRTEIEGKTQIRAYSLSSSPNVDVDLTVTIKEVEDGLVSRILNRNIKPGDEIEVSRPRGKFTIELEPNIKRQHFLFAAGSGGTPILSLLKSILFVEQESKVILVYSNKSKDKIIFLAQINELQQKYNGRFDVIHFLTETKSDLPHINGRIDKQKTSRILADYQDPELPETHYYLCGPKGMMREIEEALSDINVDKQFIHRESFNSGKESEEVYQQKIISDNIIPVKSDYDVKILLYNEEHVVSVKTDETILEAAMREGLDPPFSCQIGACASCRAKMTNGNVVMDYRDALTDEEIEEGFILTCQSHPATENVYINFDEQY